MPQVKIASWNVNSIKARLPNFLIWLEKSKPDIVLLQELKCLEVDFPFATLTNLGYNCAVSGQKAYNGVAILSRFQLSKISKELPIYNIEEFDEQARYIEALIDLGSSKQITVASIYVPNGGSELNPGQKVNQTDKFLYKMRFFDRLYEKFSDLSRLNQIAILGGDYNVALNDLDAYDPLALQGSVCFHLDEKIKFRSLINIGYTDVFRTLNPNLKAFTWWDYRGNSWNYNHGLRIDYLLASPRACDYMVTAAIEDKTMEQEKPSDHCPVSCVLEI